MADLSTTESTSSCCSTEAQASCCEPSAKASCCETSAAGGRCGCSAGRVAALTDAGLTDVEIRPTHRVQDQAASAIVRARKP